MKGGEGEVVRDNEVEKVLETDSRVAGDCGDGANIGRYEARETKETSEEGCSIGGKVEVAQGHVSGYVPADGGVEVYTQDDVATEHYEGPASNEGGFGLL